MSLFCVNDHPLLDYASTIHAIVIHLLDNTTIVVIIIHAVEIIVATLFVQVLCGITIAMGIIMAIWDCSHLMVTSSTRNSRPQQVVTLVPVNSTQPVHVTTAV